jgi:hypothetical protein
MLLRTAAKEGKLQMGGSLEILHKLLANLEI